MRFKLDIERQSIITYFKRELKKILKKEIGLNIYFTASRRIRFYWWKNQASVLYCLLQARLTCETICCDPRRQFNNTLISFTFHLLSERTMLPVFMHVFEQTFSKMNRFGVRGWGSRVPSP